MKVEKLIFHRTASAGRCYSLKVNEIFFSAIHQTDDGYYQQTRKNERKNQMLHVSFGDIVM